MFVKDLGEQDYFMNEFKNKIKELSQKYEDKELVLVILWTLFLKENQLGQSVYTQYVEETKCPIDQNGPLPEFEFDLVSTKNERL